MYMTVKVDVLGVIQAVAGREAALAESDDASLLLPLLATTSRPTPALPVTPPLPPYLAPRHAEEHGTSPAVTCLAVVVKGQRRLNHILAGRQVQAVAGSSSLNHILAGRCRQAARQ